MIEQSERDQLITLVLSARTTAQVDAAETALSDYLASYPDDLGLQDGYEQLAMMRDAFTPDESASESFQATAAVPASPTRPDHSS